MNKNTFPKLSEAQVKVLDEIINGAEIQVTTESLEKTTYDLCYPNGDSDPIHPGTFHKLKQHQLIKHAYSPSLEAERWK